MKVVSEKISFVSDPAKDELILLLGGFRITLSSEEAELLGEAIACGLRDLDPDVPDKRDPELAMLLHNDVGRRDKVTPDAPRGDRQPAASARARLGR